MAWAPGSDYVSRDGNVTFRDTGGQFAERVDEYGHPTGTYTNVNDLIPMSWLRPPENTQQVNAGAAPVVRPPVAPLAPPRPASAPTLAPPSGGGGMAPGWRGAPQTQAYGIPSGLSGQPRTFAPAPAPTGWQSTGSNDWAAESIAPEDIRRVLGAGDYNMPDFRSPWRMPSAADSYSNQIRPQTPTITPWQAPQASRDYLSNIAAQYPPQGNLTSQRRPSAEPWQAPTRPPVQSIPMPIDFASAYSNQIRPSDTGGITITLNGWGGQ